MLLALLVVTVVGLGGCAASGTQSCPAGMDAMQSESLYFGTNSPSGPVTLEQWAAFLAEVVTPRFPDGLTVVPASGQWRNAAGTIEREGTYVLNITHSASATDEQSFREIVAAYKTRFQQESVLRVRSDVCATFQN